MNLLSVANLGRIGTNLYWFSLFLPGLAAFDYLKSRGYKWSNGGFTKLLFSFLATLLFFVPVTFISYIFKLDILWLFLFYFVVELVSIGFLLKKSGELINTVNFKEWIKKVPLIIYVFILFLIIDYALSSYIGAYAFGDSLVHMGKIFKTVQNQVSIADPYFKGAIESRYHVNIFHLLYGIPAKFGIQVTAVWQNSFAFSRFLIWIAFFALVDFFTNSKKVAAGTSILAVGLLSGSLYYANLPNQIVFIFFVTLLISFARYLENKTKQDYLFIFGSALIIGLIHPVYSLMELIFVLGVLGLGLIFRKLSFKELFWFTPVLAALTWSPLFSASFPNIMTKQSANVGIGKHTLLQFGHGLSALNPGVSLRTLPSILLMVVAAVLVFVKLDSCGKRICFAGSFLFAGLTIYNPLIFPVFNKLLPVWALQRFEAVNVFQAILVPLAVLIWLSVILGKLKFRSLEFFVLALIILLSGLNYYQGFPKLIKIKDKSKGYYALLTAIRDLRKDIPDGSIVAANNEVSMALPDVLNANVVSMYEENATPTVDMARNNKLRKDIFSTNTSLQKEAILQSGANYIIYIPEEKKYFQNNLFTTINPSGFLSVAKVNK